MQQHLPKIKWQNISTCFCSCSTSTLTIINMHASTVHKDCLCLTVFMIPVLQPADYGNITGGAPFGCPIKCAKEKLIRMKLLCRSSPQTLKTVEPPSRVYRYHKLSAIMHQINSPANYITLWTYTYSKYLDAMKPFLHHKRLHYIFDHPTEELGQMESSSQTAHWRKWEVNCLILMKFKKANQKRGWQCTPTATKKLVLHWGSWWYLKQAS